ncbi:hypothetical protein GDO78_014627 [Eleutherodactylus coqui]|uniref:C2H2-type domain-containing protein n=1 Tax=Eleutherodactylus coqui TaxID=57060 RepID=A0A8J6ELV3_ELECQ|nr:hypothetical protein GDO78_014627 [Eleutherodactylus coqui]
MQVNEDGPSEATTKLEPKTENAKPLRAAEESGLESRLFTTSGVEVCEVNNSNIPCTESSLNPSSATRSPIKLIEKRISSSNGSGSSVRYESAKVVDSTNSLTVLSPVVFGSPLQPLQSVPKGKLPILPYSKMKKSVASEAIKAKPSIGPTSVQTTPCEVQITSPSVNVLNFSALDSPRQPNLTSDPGIHINQNYSFARKRGKKRKTYSEILGYQTKIRLVGKKIITCKDKYKAQAEVAGKSETSSKKYRNIMPKPMGEFQSLASLSASNPLLNASTTECHLKNRFGSRLHRWRQGDHSLTPKSTAKVLYKCHVCDHSFQFKHHLQDHLNGHSNRRPYHCRLCRKAYVHSGSLSTHMKLHHSESRLKKLMCCEFCAKVFGHIRVYIGHLKEVHRVAISTESSCKLGKKSLTLKARPENSLLLQRNKSVSTEGDSVPRPNDGVQLQIRCGRCPFVATAFSAMKLHLFGVHGDESQEVLPEGVLQCGRGAQEEVVEEATHQWKLLDESRNGAEGYGCLVSTMKEPLVTPSADGEHPPGLSSQIKFFCRDHFNCLLCAEAYKSRQEVFRHWEEQHNCENPTLLWALFSSLPQNEQKNT